VDRECDAPPDRCEGLVYHFDAVPECSGAPPSCSFTEETATCTAKSPSCTAGFLTTYAAGCDAAGCTETSTITSCFDPESSCMGNILFSYAPACADDSACGTPISSMTTCTGHNECAGRVLSTYGPSCDAIDDRCEEMLLSTTDCGFLDDCFCSGVPPNATQQIVAGFCTVQSGCGFATSPPQACPNTCSCNPRVCN
jgi:hypothetical protein